MKYSIIGAGSWGVTLAQVLTDNGHEPLLYDIDESLVTQINQGYHPLLKVAVTNLLATTNLSEILEYSDYLIISIPTAFIREFMIKINQKLKHKYYFINVSKGIEPDSLKRVSEIIKEEIDQKYYGNFCLLAGPSHAEELILRQLTLLTAASEDLEFAKKIQRDFNNDIYLRVYTTPDLIGAEIGGSVKNAIAVASGVSTGLGFGENARAALITKGIHEIIQIVEFMGGKRETAWGLTGIGDLIVTASSEHSRNFLAGKKIGKGQDAQSVLSESKMTVEGIRAIIAMNNLANKYNLDLPIIQTSYLVIQGKISVSDAIAKLLSRELKSEKI